MNRTLCRSSRAFLGCVLTGAFIHQPGELPMLAAPPATVKACELYVLSG